MIQSITENIGPDTMCQGIYGTSHEKYFKLAAETRLQVVREKWLPLDTLYVSFMSEKHKSSIAPFF